MLPAIHLELLIDLSDLEVDHGSDSLHIHFVFDRRTAVLLHLFPRNPSYQSLTIGENSENLRSSLDENHRLLGSSDNARDSVDWTQDNPKESWEISADPQLF